MNTHMNSLNDSLLTVKSIAALLLVKKDSVRLPEKNFKEFHGKPCFLWNVEKCKKLFAEVYVSSDSKDILKLAERAGAIPIKRQKKLCGDTPDIPVFQHAMGKMDCDAFIAVHANNPTMHWSTIKMCKLGLVFGAEEVMTCHPMKHGKDYKKQHNKIYGSVRGMTRRRLENYPDPYRPNPDLLIVDDSIEIETQKDWDQAYEDFNNRN